MKLELTEPVNEKHGWPWQANVEAHESIPGGVSTSERGWPRVSIITPSYNQAVYLEATIRSVLLQEYPNLEYIVVDGGSEDGSVDIIRKYEPWLAYWVSEPDSGQAEAINKGFKRATGSIVGWLNSDDILRPNVLQVHVKRLQQRPEAALVYGDCRFIDRDGETLSTWKTHACDTRTLLLTGNQIPQQTVLMRRSFLESAGWVDERFHYIMDYQLWVRLGLLGELVYSPEVVADFRFHDSSKTVTNGYLFVEETLEWLSQWTELNEVLLPTEQSELYKRLHLRAALEGISIGDKQLAANHLQLALSDRPWPYDDLDGLASYIAEYTAYGGQSIYDTWEQIAALHELLLKVTPGASADVLWRRIAARYHMHHMFKAYGQSQFREVRNQWLQGVRCDPRWLGNVGVLSIGLKALLDKLVAKGSWL